MKIDLRASGAPLPLVSHTLHSAAQAVAPLFLSTTLLALALREPIVNLMEMVRNHLWLNGPIFWKMVYLENHFLQTSHDQSESLNS